MEAENVNVGGSDDDDDDDCNNDDDNDYLYGHISTEEAKASIKVKLLSLMQVQLCTRRSPQCSN